MIKVINLIFGISSQVLILTLFLELFKFFEKHPFFQFSLSLFLNVKETLFSDFKDTCAYTLQSEVAPPGNIASCSWKLDILMMKQVCFET